MNIIEKLQWRYATKKFDNQKKLSRESIETLKKAFDLTATSYGLQPIKLVIVSDDKVKEELLPHSWNQKQVVQASHILIFCIETAVDERYIKGYFDLVKDERSTPDEVLSPFRSSLIKSFEKMTEEEKYIWASKQAYLAMGNLLTVCSLMEVDACPMEGFLPAKYDEILSLKDKGLSSVLVMPVGYRAEDDMFSNFKKVRRGVSESVIEL
ncbi:NAD(P)H-dependent oxidoreductase [Ascidiimonas sp. W6]|uniref:NAD(P)H-dependent oxidoreductase n=1 Tax=Ascidiimonas meishanensis TaxID=3128903 RepID=UPI0030EB7B3B